MIQDQLSRCGLHPKKFDLNKASVFVDRKLQSSLDESPTPEEGGACSFSTLEVALWGTGYRLSAKHAEHESQLYSKAMRVFCDIKSQRAFETDYVWPSLEMHREVVWKAQREAHVNESPYQRGSRRRQREQRTQARN